MDLLPLIRDLGFPVALVIYFLWHGQRFIAQARKDYEHAMSQIAKIQDARVQDWMGQSKTNQEHGETLVQVVDRNTKVLLQVKALLSKDDDTDIIVKDQRHG
jgi:hypothetical protein